MSEKIVNTFTFYGNEQVKVLEQELIQRFLQDKSQGNDEMTAVKRILFGLSQDDDFDAYEMIGAHWAWHFGSTKKFELESGQCGLDKLQDHITLHAAKIDPNVVVQMDYSGEIPELIGTRITCIGNDGVVLATQAEEQLNHWFCDEDDIAETITELEEHGNVDPAVMTYQDLHQMINDLRVSAISNFNAISGKDAISLTSP